MKRDSTGKAQEHRSESGFSLLEALIVVSILMVAAGIFVPKVNSAIKDSVVANGYDTALMTLRQAREAAVAERRVYIVTFTAPRTVSIAPKTADTKALNITRDMPGEVQFTAITGIPNTVASSSSGGVTVGVPDGLGTGPSTGAICFDVGVSSTGTNTVYFWPDGSARDENDNLNMGVLYIARPGDLMSSRAITVWGLSGRIRGWRLIKSGTGVTAWRQQ